MRHLDELAAPLLEPAPQQALTAAQIGALGVFAGLTGEHEEPLGARAVRSIWLCALVLSLTYVPALATLLLKPKGDHQPLLARALRALYAPVLGLRTQLPVRTSVHPALQVPGR